MATKTEIMKKIKGLEGQSRVLKHQKHKTQDKALINEIDAKLSEIVKQRNALMKEYEMATDEKTEN